MIKRSGTPAALTIGRTFWGSTIGAVAFLLANSLQALTPGHAVQEDRTIAIFNIHTKATDTVTFKRGGRYDREALKRLNYVMRDWRLDIETEMEPKLFDLLWELKTELRHVGPIHLISGHRSQKTNNMLRRTRGGQAKRSLHIRGSAADVFFPGVPLKRLRNAALVKQRGGVGYYPRSGQSFVHIDTGRVRHWPRIPQNRLAAILKGGIPRVPVRAVKETAVAALEAPAPIQKPLQALAKQPAPFKIASLDTELKPRSPSVAQALAATPTTETRPHDWGESWLTPSRPQNRQRPRFKPSSVTIASPAIRFTPSLAPSSLTAFADAGRPEQAPGSRLLGGANAPLSGMLADAERLTALASLGAEVDLTASEDAATAPMTATAGPQGLPDIQMAPGTEAPATPARPIYTASLSPARFLTAKRRGDTRFRAVLFAPAHAHVFEPSPHIADPMPTVANASDGLGFRGDLFASTSVGTFTPVRNDDGYEVSSLRVVEAGRGNQNGIVALARKAIAWLTGS